MPDGNAQDGPPDPFSQLAAGAAQVHEAFTSFVSAGFSEIQALYLVACILTGGPKAAP